MTQPEDQVGTSAKTEDDDYDSPWKTAVECYFPEFMAFFFPLAHARIDWSKPYFFLDQELLALSRDAELGKRLLDKLVQVTLLNGNEEWIYVHIEVQGEPQTEFPERIFVYNYRIYDRYRRPVASLAVLADERASWKPCSFGFEALGCKLMLEFPIAKLTDYHNRMDELLESTNAFALITAAHILTQRTRKNEQARLDAKRMLVRILYQRDWDKQRVLNLYYAVDWLLRLPVALEQQIRYEIHAIEEAEKMQYVSSVERLAKAEGRQEGRQEAEHDILGCILRHRFGELPDTIVVNLKQADEPQLKLWLIKAISAPTLDAVFNDNMIH